MYSKCSKDKTCKLMGKAKGTAESAANSGKF
jgi:hypothetical protein